MMAACDSFLLLLKQATSDLYRFGTSLTNVLAIVGAWYTLRFTVKLGSSIICCMKTTNFLCRRRNFVKQYGSWAVVTGCTSGIGKAFVRELASKRLNLILISRNSEALQKEASYLENFYGISTLALVHDFNLSTIDSMKEIKEMVNNLDIGILVNNVGLHYEYPMQFDLLSAERANSIVQVNMSSTVAMTHAVLPGMIHRKRGLIINMSSSAASLPIPLISLYSACKKFVDHFSQSLFHELSHHNVHIQSLIPFYIASGMCEYSSTLKRTRLIVPSPETYAKHAVRTFGYYKVNTGYFPHTIQAWVHSLCPNFLAIKVGHHLQLMLNREGKSSKKED